MIDDLNARFGNADLTFTIGQGGLPKADIRNRLGSADVYLHGAHLTAFQPADAGPVLWMSEQAAFAPPKPIRGGVPICWPWFGGNPDDTAKPQHGFARNRRWTVRSARSLPDDATVLTLGLRDDPETRAIWPHAFDLEFTLTVGSELRMDLRARNTGDSPVEIGAALHTYFAVGDITQVSISGLDGREYHDQLDGMRVKSQSGDVRIDREVDRIYIDTEDTCFIDDPSMSRRIRVAKEGSRSTVVWNPWVAKAARMPDFPDDGYRTMVCIETTNAAGDVRTLGPGQEHTLTQFISLS